VSVKSGYYLIRGGGGIPSLETAEADGRRRVVSDTRAIGKLFAARPILEGAGVRLKRVFGFSEVPELDPFLLLDDFGSDDPADYLAGFPWHPHRGIETITYMLHGRVEHGDSLGNAGTIGPGDVQWMTAGSGIVHQEMPRTASASGGASAGESPTLLRGLQLWSNLPAASKMMDPRYQEVKSRDIPVIELSGGAVVRVICGLIDGVAGPVKDIMTDPEYLDVSLPGGARFEHQVQQGHTVFAYVMEGGGFFSAGSAGLVGQGNAILFGDGDQVDVAAGPGSVRFLLVSGRPLREPVAWRGPIVMNTEEELRRAFQEYHEGTFVKRGSMPHPPA
jgi:redox-sensitive bicupin YhaK (pirin superfamily)